MKYKAVLFDLDDTLLDFDAGNRIAVNTLMDEIGYFDKDRYDQYEEINSMCWSALEKGKLTIEELRPKRLEIFFEKYGVKADLNKAVERFEELLGQQSILFSDSEEVLKKISNILPVGIITNGIKHIQRNRLSKSVIMNYVSCLVISDEIGVTKPNKEIFEYALKQMNVKADECLMIGDGIYSDVLGANNAGIDMCYLNKNNKSLPEGISCKYMIKELKDCVDIALS